jgi:hypothetical protein
MTDTVPTADLNPNVIPTTHDETEQEVREDILKQIFGDVGDLINGKIIYYLLWKCV